MLRLCAFAYEASKSIEGQVKALKKNGIGLLELRSIDGENLYINGEKIAVKKNGKIVGKSVCGASHFTIIKDFYEKIQSGEKFPLGYYEAEKVIKLILAMYASKGE